MAATAPEIEMLAQVVAVEMLGFEGRAGVRLADVAPWPDLAIEVRFASQAIDLAREHRRLLDLDDALGVTEELAVALDARARSLASLEGERPGISSPSRLSRLFAIAAAALRGDGDDASKRS